jgi:bla regulator protein BlaR1
MLRYLLEDRFRLNAHKEQRPTLVYALVISRSDGRLGPDLQRVERPCTRDQILNAQFGVPGAEASCASQADVADIVDYIRSVADRPVIDKTGLSGYFKVTWSYEDRARDDNVNRQAFAGVTSNARMPLIERLGLKLESRTEPLDVLVIDHIERPTPD